MSSGFVSGGTSDEPIKRDGEWLKVQQELEAKRQQKLEAGRQEGGKTLYEVLQSNKDAKQEAFEESIRLKNQFRSLDEDEVEFLDSVLESTRAKEAAIRKETTEQLSLFRKQQEAAEKATIEEPPAVDPKEAEGHSSSHRERWASTGSKKRRREKDRTQAPSVKLRKSSSSAKVDPEDRADLPKSESNVSSTKHSGEEDSISKATSDKKEEVKKEIVPATTLGLVGYDSDED